MKQILAEFRDFAVKGNVLDMAVGVIIGGAFGGIVGSLVSDVLMPPIGFLMGGVDFSNLMFTLAEAVGDKPAVTVKYGLFINMIIKFVIVAFSVFLLVRGVNSLKKKQPAVPAAPPAPSKETLLLTEIRDILKARS